MGRIGDHRASQINWARAAFNLFCESLEMTPGGSANWLLCFHNGSGRIKVLLETTDFLFWDVAMSQELNTVAFGLAASLSWGVGSGQTERNSIKFLAHCNIPKEKIGRFQQNFYPTRTIVEAQEPIGRSARSHL